MNEELYITGFNQGNEDVYRMIFEKYHTRLCYFATSLLPLNDAAEDVVQEAFIKLWQKKEHFSDFPAIKSFLYTTVKNRCLNIRKHDKVVKKYGDLLHEEKEEPDTMEKMIESEVLEKLNQAIQELPAGCRNVMQLGYFKGLKNKEIAEKLQVSINTVKTQKKRGLQLLRVIMKVTSLFL